MAGPARKPDFDPESPRVPLPPLGPKDTLVWDEVTRFGALGGMGRCVFVLYHRQCKDRPCYIGHSVPASDGASPPVLLRLLFWPLRALGVRCFITRLTPFQFERVRRIEAFLVREWRPLGNRPPAPNAKLVSPITYRPWDGEHLP